jgi:hypothetical protein
VNSKLPFRERQTIIDSDDSDDVKVTAATRSFDFKKQSPEANMDMADTQYLKDNVGDALALGMAEVMMLSPQDPVQALGLYLLKYADTIELQSKVIWD